MKPEYVYVAYNTNRRYFAMGSVSYSPQRVRDFMAADKAEWRRDQRKGWKVLKCQLMPPKRI